MSRAARSLFVFGCYVTAVGLALLAAPQPVFALLRLPASSDGWIRTVGLLALVIGAYDITGAWIESRVYLRVSVYVRVGFAAGAALLVGTGQMLPGLLLIGGTDFAGAIWTAAALRRERAGA